MIYALKPELVVTTTLRDPEMARAIERSGATLLPVEQANLEQVPDAVAAVGEAAGVAESAREYATWLRHRIEQATADVPEDRRPRVFIELSGQPLRTAANGSFLDDLIGRAGGRNIAHDMKKAWTTISPSTVVARNPDIIIVAHPTSVEPRVALRRRTGWDAIGAVTSGWVIGGTDGGKGNINLDALLRPGPRMVDGLEALADLFARYREEAAR
jgi:iron complex transport system substrate-binding protein